MFFRNFNANCTNKTSTIEINADHLPRGHWFISCIIFFTRTRSPIWRFSSFVKYFCCSCSNVIFHFSIFSKTIQPSTGLGASDVSHMHMSSLVKRPGGKVTPSSIRRMLYPWSWTGSVSSVQMEAHTVESSTEGLLEWNEHRLFIYSFPFSISLCYAVFCH